jgi:cytochrome c-type biogenesis protein
VNDISFIVAFSGGILSFFSPCVLPLVPAYIANLAGITAIDTKGKKNIWPTFLHSIFFVIGFSLIFIFLGASVGLIGTAVTANAVLLRWISGILVIVFGIYLIAALKVPWLNYEKRVHVSGARSPGYLRSLILGAAFALGWTPCVGPILGTILALAWNSQQVWHGAGLLTVYSLGMGIPFLLIGLLWGFVMPLWKSINRHLGIISIVSGILLIIVGILILTNNMSKLMQLFSA